MSLKKLPINSTIESLYLYHMPSIGLLQNAIKCPDIELSPIWVTIAYNVYIKFYHFLYWIYFAIFIFSWNYNLTLYILPFPLFNIKIKYSGDE